MSPHCNVVPSASGTAKPHRRRRMAPAAASGMDALAGGVRALEHTVSGIAATAQEYRHVEDGNRESFGGGGR